MEWAELRGRCERRVRELVTHVGLPDPWSINEFLDRLEHHRGGREIDLLAVQWTPGESAGAWRAYTDHDVIAYSENTSAIHQDAIILHELAHMLAGHQGRCILSEEEAQRRAPDLAPAAFTHILERVNGPSEEHEAEMTAIMVLSEISRQLPRPRPHESALARNVEAAFG